MIHTFTCIVLCCKLLTDHAADITALSGIGFKPKAKHQFVEKIRRVLDAELSVERRWRRVRPAWKGWYDKVESAMSSNFNCDLRKVILAPLLLYQFEHWEKLEKAARPSV